MTLNMSSRSGSGTLTMDFDSRTSANKSKFIKDRVTYVERSFGSICDTFGAIARKNGKLRDKQDELCQHMLGYAENVTYNSSSKASLSQLSRELASCNDYEDTMVKRLEAHVIEPLMIFDTVIKNSRAEIQSAFAAVEKEQKSKKAVDSMREKHPSDRHKLHQAETELQKAKVDASRSTKALEEAIDAFEQKKLKDMKSVLGNYIRIQMSYHAKSLESLTKAYKTLAIYDDEEDLEEFRNVLHPTSAAERQQMLRSVTGSRQSLNSEKSEYSLRSSGSRSATPKPILQQPQPTANKADMFAAQAAPTKTSRSPSASPQHKQSPERRQAPRSAMLGDDSDSDDDEDDDSESELEAVPTSLFAAKR